ncbi:CBD9-like protein [Coprinopsis marcescibilis]|uniref:CBD9-like protein n=1 Tax=Coprinopsis marcescibilis TaxID=230819 RepID=A0A5C3KLC2_COPMA|nr:CBD9-like protein [Coprinopsis marcescibilis]
MLAIFGFLLVIGLQALSVSAQTVSRWCDSWTNVCFQRFYDASIDTGWGYLFPSTPRTEFIGIFTAPVGVGWVGTSLGGGMRSNPLLLAWVNGQTPLISVRSTAQYAPPSPITGPRVTILGSSGANATHQRIVYRCENCTTWSGGTGGINQNGNHMFGYATHANIKPSPPNSATAGIQRHTLANQFSLNTVDARSTTYDAQLTLLVNTPPLVPGGPPIIITTSSSSSTSTTPITQTSTSTSTAPGPTQSLYGQCGGLGWSGPTQCPVGAVCRAANNFFHQCVPA